MAWSKHKYQKLLAALKEMGIDIMEIETRIYHTGNGKTENTLKLVLLPEYPDGFCIKSQIPQELPPPSTKRVLYHYQSAENPVLWELPTIYQLGTDTNINSPCGINTLIDTIIQNLDNVQRRMRDLRPLLEDLRVSLGFGLHSRQPVPESMNGGVPIGLQSDGVKQESGTGIGDPCVGGEEK